MLKRGLQIDWQNGIENLNQWLRYSLQFIPVIRAVNEVVEQIPYEQIIYRLSQLAEDAENPDLLKYCSVSLNNYLKSQAVRDFFNVPPFNFLGRIKERLQDYFPTDFRSDVPYRAVAAGFWFLQYKFPNEAKLLFEQAIRLVNQEKQDLLYGQEMYFLADTLDKFYQAKTLLEITNLNPPQFPTEPHLRPNTWQTITQISEIIEDVQLIQEATSQLSRSSALNRAIGNLQEIININSHSHPQQLPKTERGLILEIAQTWQEALQNIAKEVGEIKISEPIEMPYIIGPAVEGQLFKGREDILRTLQSLWSGGKTMQSVVLYGHRRMGKTSILKNINAKLGNKVTLIYVNLQGLGDVQQGTGEVLLELADEMADTLNIKLPDIDELLKLPERTFKQFLKQALEVNPNQALLIALDEFETLETLIETQKIDRSLMAVFRTWTQLSPRLGIIFAGLHTLQEKVGNYNHSFFSSFIPIRVSFLSPSDTDLLLTQPSEDFPLNYSPEILTEIYQLTHGQPFLVQLIGFQLVSRYNRKLTQSQSLTSAKKSAPSTTLTLSDLNEIINHDFFQQGSFYFEGIWRQAQEGAIAQTDILTLLAPHPNGLTESELFPQLQLTEEQFKDAIDTLERHDVIKTIDGYFKIIVELFRRWLTYQD
ncbi:MAG: AAA-like domain-containing protein [Microcystaceae cyanobacterium]